MTGNRQIVYSPDSPRAPPLSPSPFSPRIDTQPGAHAPPHSFFSIQLASVPQHQGSLHVYMSYRQGKVN
jgi:hypothetical protein